MGGNAAKYGRSASKLGVRKVGTRALAATAALAVGIGLTAAPAGALPISNLSTPTVRAMAPAPATPVVPIALPRPLAPLPTPAPKVVPIAPTVPAPHAVIAPVLQPIVAPVVNPVAPVLAPVGDQVVKAVLAAPAAAGQAVSGAVKNVAGAVAPLAPVTRPVAAATAPTKAPVRAARELVAPLRTKATTPEAATGRAADELSVPTGPIVRLTDGRQLRIVPRSVCSTQVAAAQPESTALCRSITPEEAAELGLSADTESASSTVAGLPLTGVSIAALAIIGALALGLGFATRPFRRSRIAKRAALTRRETMGDVRPPMSIAGPASRSFPAGSLSR